MGNHPKVIQILHVDGDENGKIHCFKSNQPCHTSLGMLNEQIKIIEEPEENPFVLSLSGIAETTPAGILIDDDEEGDEEIEVLL